MQKWVGGGFLLLCSIFGSLPAATAQERSPFLILDPGHGGKDQGGSHGKGFFFNGRYYPEDAYAYDVAKRIEALAAKRDWHVFFTVVAPTNNTIANAESGTILPKRDDLIYNLPGQEMSVFSGPMGLRLRLEAINQGVHPVAHEKVVFISLHFDYAPSRVGGAKIYTTPELADHPFIKLLAQKFKATGLGFTARGITRSAIDADEEFIVLVEGAICPRILLELGNFFHHRDRNLILSPAGRQQYAKIIVAALAEWIAQHGGKENAC